MTEERWARVKTLFDTAVDIEPSMREQFVRDAASNDVELRDEVLSLLRADSDAPPLLNPFFSARDASEPRIGPYRLGEIVGRGGMGVVYRALDERRQRTVALKTLQRLSMAALSRFKQEFRGFADIRHPNLVALYELLADRDQWCFTMEFVEGVQLTRALDRGKAIRDSLFAQLAAGVAALHAAGRLHRDLKPSNVLVTNDNRAVVVDFGLGAELDITGHYETTAGRVFGSVAYMSPEQAAGGTLTVASDWYSVGVMLFEALTGQLPYTGHPLDILAAKRSRDPSPPRSISADVRPDLEALCVGLLRLDPSDRPSEAEVRHVLGTRSGPEPAVRIGVGPGLSRDTSFVGRSHELALLTQAYLAARDSVPVVVYISGDSGSGKTALVHRFLDDIAADPAVVEFRGRCHEQESVPFKALDSLVDSIARYLRRLGEAEVNSLLPRDIRILARVFPVLSEIRSVAFAPFVGSTSVDSQELRRRAAAALRELLARVGDRHKLVLFIDDLQWGDLDSAAMLSDILTPPDPPALLAIGCYRREDEQTSPFLTHIERARKRAPRSYDQRLVTLGPLEPEDALELARRLMNVSARSQSPVATTVARESAGSPFLVYELVQHSAPFDTSNSEHHLSLDDILWQRIERLPTEARRLLEVVSVAGRPLDLAGASEVAGIESDDRAVVPLLTATRLARSIVRGHVSDLEAYHDRVRQTVLRHLAPLNLAAHHRELARHFKTLETPDIERLAFHLHGAGSLEEAAEHYARAAESAADALAFTHAATLCRQALSLRSWPLERECAIRTLLGDALSNAGRASEAAVEYLLAEARAVHHVRIELRRRAGLALLTSGHIDEGLSCLRPLLESIGMRLAGPPWRALVSLLLRRAQLRLRGTRFNERTEGTCEPDELQRIDISWSVVVGLSMVDPIRGADFQTRSLLRALDAGEPFRVARALAVEAGHLASSGSLRRASAILAESDQLAQRLARPYSLGMVTLARGTIAYFGERWKDSLTLCRRAAEIFRGDCRGATWETDTANAFSLWSLAKMGEIAELARVSPPLLKDAHERGDRYAATNLSTQIMAMVRLASDDPVCARDELDAVMGKWSQNGYHVQHHDALLAFVPIELYRGEEESAWRHVQSDWAAFRWSLLSQVQDLRVEMLQLRAFCALAMMSKAPSKARFASSALKDAHRLCRERLPWTVALASYIRGIVAVAMRDRDTSRRELATAITRFEQMDAHLHAAATRWRLAFLVNGDEGSTLRGTALDWFSSQGVVNPDRFVAAYAPGPL